MLSVSYHMYIVFLMAYMLVSCIYYSALKAGLAIQFLCVHRAIPDHRVRWVSLTETQPGFDGEGATVNQTNSKPGVHGIQVADKLHIQANNRGAWGDEKREVCD